MKPNTERLEKLLAHMRSDKRGHTKFTFAYYSIDLPGESQPCGTAGCMAGELPTVFPNEWRFVGGLPGVVESADEDVEPGEVSVYLRKFFGLGDDADDFDASRHIFFPGHQKPDLFGGQPLTYDASLESVLSNLEIFITKAKAGDFENL